MRAIADYRPEIEAKLSDYLGGLKGPIYDPARYILENGGKRIRPCLLLASVDAFGGASEESRDEAIAIEIFHNFTLLHDDVMDEADSRRGRPTVHLKWNQNQAILTGDIMFSMAFDLLLKREGGLAKEALKTFNTTAAEVCIGQQMDLDFEQRQDVRPDDYLEMIRLKTSVLLGASMAIGAMLAGAWEDDIRAIYDYALNVGLAFQMQDDYLDAFGDMEKVGKKSGGDILRNKKTLLLLNAQTMATTDDRKALAYWLEDAGDGAAKVAAIKEVMQRSGAVEDLMKRKSECMDKAIERLEATSLSSDWKEMFKTFSQEQLTREF